MNGTEDWRSAATRDNKLRVSGYKTRLCDRLTCNEAQGAAVGRKAAVVRVRTPLAALQAILHLNDGEDSGVGLEGFGRCRRGGA